MRGSEKRKGPKHRVPDHVLTESFAVFGRNLKIKVFVAPFRHICYYHPRMTESEAENMEITEDAGERNRVYEIGFHLIPSLSEEEVSKEVVAIKKAIEDAGGVFIAEGYPKMRTLEYTIEVPITMPKSRFSHAQFGWIKFEAEPEAVSSIKKAVSGSENVIRMIIVKTVRDNTLYGYKLKQKKEAEERREEEAKKNSENFKVSDEEIDKSIDEIIV